MRAEAARVTTTLPGGQVLAAHWPADPPAQRFDTVVPVHHDGTVIAEISVAGAGARTGDVALLRHTTAVSAAALRNLRLLAELNALHATIQQQNLEIAASRRRLVAAAEVERHRLARLVAERLGPDLDALRQALPDLGRQVSAQPETVVAECRRLADHASHLVDEMRALSRGVLPPLLLDHGLAAALRALLRRLDLPTTLDAGPAADGARFPVLVETTVYLCCQAAVGTATVAGCHASSTALRLWRDDGVLAFSVSHDARHLWTDELAALRDRVSTLGGTLTATPDGHWSALTGVVPLDPLPQP
jgi:signal transduction histidine kinase